MSLHTNIRTAPLLRLANIWVHTVVVCTYIWQQHIKHPRKGGETRSRIKRGKREVGVGGGICSRVTDTAFCLFNFVFHKNIHRSLTRAFLFCFALTHWWLPLSGLVVTHPHLAYNSPPATWTPKQDPHFPAQQLDFCIKKIHRSLALTLHYACKKEFLKNIHICVSYWGNKIWRISVRTPASWTPISHAITKLILRCYCPQNRIHPQFLMQKSCHLQGLWPWVVLKPFGQFLEQVLR